jgi:hypothetical protein
MKKTNRKKILGAAFMLALAALTLLLPHTVYAATSSTSPTTGLSGMLAPLWDDFLSLISGYGGMFIAAGLIIMGIFESKKIHPVMFFVNLLLAGAIFLIPTLTQGAATATFIRPKHANIAAIIIKKDVQAVNWVQNTARNVRKW